MPNNKERLREFINKVWNLGEAESATDYVADSYTIHNDPGDPWHGMTLDLDGFVERVRKSRAPFPDQEFDIQEMTSEDNRVSITWFWKGTHLGDFPGFAASGKVLTMSGATTYYFENGRITGHWQISDRAGIYQQLTS